MKRTVAITLLGVFMPLVSFAEVLTPLSIAFVREYTQDAEKETASGMVYCQPPDRIILRVTHPVDQWMVFEDTLTTIYYPASRQAFRIISRFGSYPPFVQAFVGVAERDYGLSGLGYRVRDYNIQADTLISHWTPPKRFSLFLGETILKIIDDKIVFTESKTARGETLRKSLHKKHVRYQGTYFPMEILTTEYSRTDSTFEKVVFSDPEFDSPLPEEVLNFHIPTDVEVKEVKW
ncbi:hypothetical protein E3J62_02340 [candidate division TA06 bacterium]|uniref:DUF4412 domain-containing protein n=1 Tax=candidate division TA06 bacterium TaxID=2250710 RepID=A0A523UXT8_UNCT6|nr:MAG: hypothetical protein E3J62_02340 [candidate division TA06 bacterium]